MNAESSGSGPTPSRGKRLKRFIELCFFAGACALTALTRREGPGALMRRAFKLPIWTYRIGLGRPLGDYVLLLTTTGRKSGKARVTPLEYFYDPAADTYYVAAGWEGRTDWYRNARTNPKVHVRAGEREFDAVAEPVPEATATRLVGEYSRRNPLARRMWPKWTGIPFDGSEAGLRAVAKRLPMIELRPITHEH